MLNHKIFRCAVALFLVVAMAVPVCAAETDASNSSRASLYITSYNSYITDLGNGEFQIWFTVRGTGLMDEIGTLSIELYEINRDGSLSYVKTFLHDSNSSMLKYNAYYHSSYVSFQGSSTKAYKAYVCIWAGKDGAGDSRYMWATE